MPPYTPNKSRAQQRKMFALANKGEISMSEAKGKAEATNYQSLPNRVGKRGKRLKRVSVRRGRR